jgi:site-specific recombinase XerD
LAEVPHLAEFVDEKSNTLRYSAETAWDYAKTIHAVHLRAKPLGITQPDHYLDRKNIERLQRAMLADGLRPTTIASYLRHLRAFLNWCFNEGYTDGPLRFRIECPDTKPETIERDEFLKLLRATRGAAARSGTEPTFC